MTELGIDPRLTFLAQSKLPTPFGEFVLMVFRWDDTAAHPELSREHLALVRGEVAGRTEVPVRIHSECLTSEVFGSLKCDCRQQLVSAQQTIATSDLGVLLYLRQEGRGIGLTNKIRAYALQDAGADTIQANLKLHLPVDARQYDVAAAILKYLRVQSVRLLTNNPEKINSLRKLGVEVSERVPSLVPATTHSAEYLRVKKDQLAHEIPLEMILASRRDRSQ
jgi:GTP cyclohydrolase II